ncbi:hypothetical protein Ancab_004960 [Ancistrocladus abbreviatus]
MATNYQPLLGNTEEKAPPAKFLCRTLPLLAVAAISAVALLSSPLDIISLSSSKTLSLSQVCKNAHEPSSCLAMVSEVAPSGFYHANNLDPLKVFLETSIAHIQGSLEMAKDLHHRINDGRDRGGVVDCVELMEMSMGRVVQSLHVLEKKEEGSYSNVHAWLSAVLTNYFTCLDGLQGPALTIMEPRLSALIARARASLAMLVAISPTKGDYLLEAVKDKFPSWVTNRDRKLLETLPQDIKANVVVAQDGSGNYKTVSDAIASAPNNAKTRYVIYVKKGTYKEQVEIGTNKKNIMLVGDGMDSTVITGSLNVVDGSTTFRSATVAAVGDGFIAQDIWFQNSAGPQKHQAVALRVGADQSVINRCKIDGYQDTLYAFSLRQFYRDSMITGTIDYIFGNAAVVFQNCNIVTRKPMSQQFNTVTAQGREDPNQNTGTSIQNCQIIASSDLQPVEASFKSYLGRPWQKYSRTVVMQSYIGDLIDPSGWSVWNGDFALDTLYYGEYANRGPGAGTSKRVNWKGYHVITSAAEAAKFTVDQLIQGGSWLQSTGVTYSLGL